MFKKVANVVIAVNSVQEVAKLFADNFDLKAVDIHVNEKSGVKSALIPIGDALIELVEPIKAGEGPVANFLKTKGEGLYMLDVEVDDVNKAAADLTKRGVRLVGADPESLKKAGQFFIHPKSSRGLLMQVVPKGLVERAIHPKK